MSRGQPWSVSENTLIKFAKPAIKKLQLIPILHDDELHMPLKWVRPVAVTAAPVAAC